MSPSAQVAASSPSTLRQGAHVDGSTRVARINTPGPPGTESFELQRLSEEHASMLEQFVNNSDFSY